MKPLLRKITQASAHSFSFIEQCPPDFEVPWHFHPEYELNFIKDSTGKRFMGDSIEEFSTREVILVGKNLPHFWQNTPGESLEKAKAYVVHFSEDFLGTKFFELPEVFKISNLLKLSQRGLKITGKTGEMVSAMMERFPQVKGFERLLLLQQILHLIAESEEYYMLASTGFVESFKADIDERMQKVYEYVMYNFKNKITLPQIASVAAMSEIAFCRYFKKRIGKSFFTFLTEIRIGYSCRLLLEGKLNINEVCYESGFNSLSHFNKQFRKITRESPKHYRAIYENGLVND